jgi:hypothetical protein
MEEPVPGTQFPVAGVNASAAVHTGYVALMLSGSNIHEACFIATPAISTLRNAGYVHVESERSWADPSEQHLHQTGCANETAEHMSNKDRGDQHVY